MKHNYHYVFKLDDFESHHPEYIDLDVLYSLSGYNDVLSYLDRQKFDVRSSVVSKLVEYAGNQIRKDGKSH